MGKKSTFANKNSAPVSVGQTIMVTVLRLGFRGEGVARHEGFTVFVDGILPGEIAKVRVVEVKANFARAEMLELVEGSPDRVVPPCSVFAVCGGCQVQHMTYDAQINWKRQLVVDALVRVGHFAAELVEEIVEPVKRMDMPWRYRNKVTMLAAPRGEGFVAGFVEEGTHEPVALSECLIRPEMQDELVNSLVELLVRKGVAAFDEATGRGLVRQIRVRSTIRGDAMVVLTVVAPLNDAQVLAEAIAQIHLSAGRVVSVIEEVVPLAQNSRQVSSTQERVLWGAPELIETIMGLDFYVSAQSFLQVNATQTEVLYQTALELANLAGQETVIDLYAGIGTLSLVAAKRSGRVYGVESAPAAVNDAKRNCELNDTHHAEFYLGRSEEVLPMLVRQGLVADVVMLDPPRAGCQAEVIEAMVDTGASRIVYVSCNPATLARDLARLAERGYQLERVVPVDVFPQTFHVETVCVLYKI